ncbi:MAG TPA: hemerythrin domain-containing protein [Thermoleophilaceae bacterium]|jgi:hemerythrin-like domain-containing protein
MERSDALKPLSRDHHRGLFVAMKLKRADERTASEAREAFLDFFRSDARRHFRIEEELLLPAYARHGSAEEAAVVRVLTDHVELRSAAADPPESLDSLHLLGQLLDSHIRHEERVLFPMVEQALPGDELARLGAEIERAEAA